MVIRKQHKSRKSHKKQHKSRKVNKRHNKSHKKHVKRTRRNNKKSMRGGMKPLQPADVNAPVYVPKGVPFVPPGGGASEGVANGHKYYNLAQPSLHAPNGSLEQSYGIQSGGGLIPEPLVQLGRGIMYNMERMYDTTQGQSTYISENPNVLKQRIPVPQNYDITPPDISQIHDTALAKSAGFKPFGI